MSRKNQVRPAVNRGFFLFSICFLGVVSSGVSLACGCKSVTPPEPPISRVETPVELRSADPTRPQEDDSSNMSKCAEPESCEDELAGADGDRDGDHDGDRDGDGIIDSKDACPDLCESLNGNEDDDGCPDKPLFRIDADLNTALGSIEGLVFEPDRDRMRPVSYAELDRIADVLRRHPEANIEIQGHRDENPGESVRAVDITKKRAEAVRKYLIKQGIPPSMLYAQGYGESVPIASNRTSKGRLQNRRVELVLQNPTRLVARTCKEVQ